MFMIMPTGDDGRLAPVPRPEDHRSRVKVACDRCRVKKIKCDGSLPCLRCLQEGILCVATKKPTNDPGVMTREYIQHLESQQARLVSALRLLAQPGDSIDDAQREEIMEILRSSGVKERVAQALVSRDVGNEVSSNQGDDRGVKRRRTADDNGDAGPKPEAQKQLPATGSSVVNQSDGPVFTPSQPENSIPLPQQDQELTDLFVGFDDPDLLLNMLLEQLEPGTTPLGNLNPDEMFWPGGAASTLFDFDMQQDLE